MGGMFQYFPVPFSEDKKKELQAGKHEAVFSVDNVFAFGDYRINIALQNDSERVVLSENACRFHIKGFAAEVMSVVNPQKTVKVTIR